MKTRTDVCPNPRCGKGEIKRVQGVIREEIVYCDVCGARIFVPANINEPISMSTVKVGNGQPEPIYKKDIERRIDAASALKELL